MKTIENSTTNNDEQVTVSLSEYELLKSENEKLKKKVDWLMEQFIVANQHIFGSKKDHVDVDQINIFNEAEIFEASEGTESETTEVPAHTRKTKSKNLTSKLPDNLDIEDILYGLGAEEQICPDCGEPLHVIGTENVRELLKLIPAVASILRISRNVYGCRNCEKNGTEVPIIKAPVPEPVIKGSFASAEAIAHIATQKFVMGSPLYRQEKEFNSKGIELSRQTMSNWLIKSATDHLLPIYEKMHEDLKKNNILCADETGLQVLREPEKKAESKSYMWLYRTGTEREYPIVLYEYQPDRKHKRPKEFLEGYKGYLHVDGYSGYNKLPEDIIRVGCFSHARRKFTDALKVMKVRPPDDGGKKQSIAIKGKEYCDALFDIEKDIAEFSYEKKKEKRQELAKPILDEMFEWFNGINVKSKSKTGEALTYLKNQWYRLIKYIDDGRLEISNNRAERSIKPFVIGRKNFLFANTPKGAQTSAILYSIIETAKENGLDPYEYLKYVFETSPNISDGNIEELMPNNVQVQAKCKSQYQSV